MSGARSFNPFSRLSRFGSKDGSRKMKASRPLHIRTRDSLWIFLSTRQRPIRSGPRRWRESGGPRSRSAARWIVGRGHRPFSQRTQVASFSGVFFIASCATVTGPSDLSVHQLRTARSAYRAPHGREKFARRSHDDRATSRSGRAMSGPNRAIRPSRR